LILAVGRNVETENPECLKEINQCIREICLARFCIAEIRGQRQTAERDVCEEKETKSTYCIVQNLLR